MLQEVSTSFAGHIGTAVYDSDLARRYVSLVSIEHDLQIVAGCFANLYAMLQTTAAWDFMALEAFTWQAVILYARCFDSDAKGRPRQLGGARKRMTRNQKQLHDGLLLARNRRFAHAGEQCMHRCLVGLTTGGVLEAGHQIEMPTNIADPGTAFLGLQMTESALEFARAELQRVKQELSEELASPGVFAPLRQQIEETRQHHLRTDFARRALAGIPTKLAIE